MIATRTNLSKVRSDAVKKPASRTSSRVRSQSALSAAAMTIEPDSPSMVVLEYEVVSPGLASSLPPFPDWDAEILASIEGIEPMELPFRTLLEDRFEKPLSDIEAYSGPVVETALHECGAEAAAKDNLIFFDRPDPALETVAHEVVHRLQADPDNREKDLKEGPESSPEQEAETLARDVASQKPSFQAVSGSLAQGEASFRRTPGQDVDTGIEPPAAEEFAAALVQEPTETAADPQAERQPASSAGDALREEEPAMDEALTREDGVDEEPQPTFDLPEMPDTELSPEEAAARKAAEEEAKAVIEQADSASGAVDAFAEAPPSVKAAMQASIGPIVDGVVQADARTFEAGIPAFHAEMGGSVEGEEVGEVTAPEGGPVALEEGVPAPAPDPDIPETPRPEPFEGNDGVIGFLSRLFGGNSAEAIGRSLSEVKTTDNDIETTPGEKPAVPLEGETDPGRVENQHDTGVEEAKREGGSATQAVLDGPGPERAQLMEMDEVYPMEELVTPEIDPVPPVEEAQAFHQMALPEEVVAQFDQDRGPAMQASLGEARSQVALAETEKDTRRQEKLEEAEAANQTATQAADEEQRTSVLEARRTIQQERQTTIDDQNQAVTDLETDAETERAASQESIQTRVTEDEERIATRYDETESEAQAEVEAGERDAQTEREAAEREAENQSWWDRAVDFVKSAFAALTAAINSIFDAVRAAVQGLLEAARDFAKGLIDLAADFIKSAIEAYGELLKGLVDGLLGELFPGLAAALNDAIDSAVTFATEAVDAAAETLKAGVDAIVDGLSSALNAILDAFQAGLNAALAILEAALTGDWGAVAKKILEAALRLLGIDPLAFYAYIGNVLDTIQMILDDPIGFLGNLVDAVVSGFRKFGENLLEHLQTGLVQWLTGALGDIQMPAEFSLAGLLDIARQVLGLTWAWLREKAVKLIGEQNVARLEYIYGYIETLMEGGFAALFDRIQQDLSNLVQMVLDGIKEFFLVKVIMAGITWLASLFNPVGALVKLLFTIWNFIQFLRDQLQRILQVVETVVAGIANIARGVIEPAATKVESVLANLLPVVIDLVAKLLGLTGVAAKVREIIGRVREWVDRAVDSLIERVLAAFRGGGEGGETEPAAAEEAGEAAGSVPVGEVMTVSVEDGPDHTLSIGVSGSNATVMLASDPLPVAQWLERLTEQANSLEEEEKNTALTQLQAARTTLGKLDPQADAFVQQAASAPATAEAAAQTGSPDDAAVDKLQGELRDALTHVFNLFGGSGAVTTGIFVEQIAGAHPTVRDKLSKSLEAKQEQYQTMGWEQVREDLVQTVDLFRSPLLKSHKYGETMQALIQTRLEELAKAEEVPVPEDREAFMRSWVVSKINNSGEGPYPAAREKLRGNQLDCETAGFEEAIDTAVRQSLQEFDQKNDKPDAAMVAAVSGNIGPFLKAVARKETAYNGLDISGDRWDTVYWGEPRNRNWLKARFRRGGGLHEWIPTDYVGRVVDRARESNDAEGPPTAELWVEFQDKFRSPTDILLYPPKDRYLRTAPYIRDPKPPHKKIRDKTVSILQGHVGAVHAPVRDGGYSDDVIAQTKAQGPWHDDLRKIFDANFGEASSRKGMVKIVTGVDTFIKENLWKGDSIPQPGFEEYYTRTKGSADGSDRESFSTLKSRAAGARQTIENDFKTARTAVGI